MEYLGARGTMIYEKNFKSKISCQTPFYVALSICFPTHLVCTKQSAFKILGWPLYGVVYFSTKNIYIINKICSL